MAKKRTLNEYRQTKEYQGTPRFTTKEHLNEVHNKLWGEDYYKADEYDGDIHQEDLDKIIAKQIEEEMNPSKYTENDLEQAKCSIAEKITKHFDDVMFEMVSEEMSDNYLFQSSNYLTEAGYDMFEDEWFEFYHEHHGDILHQVMQNITN